MTFRLVASTCFCVAAALGASTAACAAPLDDVMNADRAFAAAAAKDGIQAAFVAYAAADATMFREGVGPIRGHAAIGASFKNAGNASLAWAPEAGEVAASGDLAYTWGWFTFTPGDGSDRKGTGNYVSIWRRIDGQWKWIVDIGVAAPTKAK